MKPSFDAKWRQAARMVIIWIGILACFLIFLAIGIYYQRSMQPWKGFETPDDVQAGRELLAEKFKGPRYFQVTDSEDHLDPPYISVFEAQQQIKGIVKARQLPAGAEEKLQRLVDTLSEPATSHVFGVSGVNTLQLNLALDAAK